MSEPTCSTCESPPIWAVTVRDDPEERPGQLLAMCDSCRRRQDDVAVSIPLDVVDEDTFADLYATGLVRTEPGLATRIIFGEERPGLVHRVLPSRRDDRS